MEGRVPQKQINAFPRVETLRLSLFRADLLVTHTLYFNSEIYDKWKNQCCSVNGIIAKHFWTTKINKYHSMGEGELCTNLERLTNAVTRSESLQGKECNHDVQVSKQAWAAALCLRLKRGGRKTELSLLPDKRQRNVSPHCFGKHGGEAWYQFQRIKMEYPFSVNFK